MASPITIFRKAWELRKHKVAALRDVPMTEQNLLGAPQRKKVLYNGGEKEKLEELETCKPHDLAENWLQTGRMQNPCSPSTSLQLTST
jgi:hypothetical protein